MRKGLLFAGTENSVWVSFDDGDHWQSLQLNLPHTSMRDLWIHGDDLIVATGCTRTSFWILDDAACPAAGDCASRLLQMLTSSLPRPHTVSSATSHRHPLPPDEPAGANPPDGAIIDYYLAHNSSASVSLEILDAGGQLVRKFSSADNPDASEAELKKQLIPLYWLRPFQTFAI